MIYQEISASQYREDFKRKFRNFGEKSPIMISFATDELSVTVIHENSRTKYSFEWDYTIPVESFIHNIKLELLRHYPRLSREEDRIVALTAEEQADMLVNGADSNAIPITKKIHRNVVYRIDKIILMKDEFILVDEETDEQFRYKMRGSSIYFLKSYRNGEYKTLEDAGKEFFKKSSLVSKLNKS